MNHPFYESIAHGVASIVGDMIVYFTEGSWRVSIAGQEFGVRCPADCTGEMTFDYSYGTINSASVIFEPYIGITLPAVGGEVILRSATYNRLGDCTGVVFDHGPDVAAGGLQRLKRLLSLRRDANKLLLGEPFTYLTTVSSQDERAERRLIWRLRFERNGPIPGLAVKMKDHAVLKFSEPVAGQVETRSNFVIVKDGTGFSLDRVDYNFDEGTLEGSLATFNATLESGAIDASGIFLQLGNDSVLRFDNIDFGRSANGDAIVDASYGDIVAAASAGKIVLDGEDAGSELNLGGSSRVQMIGLRLYTKGGVANLTVGAGSNVDLKLGYGLLRFPALGFTSFAAGELRATIAGQWSAGAAPVVAMEVSKFAVNEASGKLSLTTITSAQFTHGEASSSNLAFRSGVGLTGAFNRFRFGLTPGTTVVLGEGASFQAAAGGNVDATYGGVPFELTQGTFPRGVVSFDQPFIKLQAGSPAAFVLSDGNVNLVLRLASDGSFAGDGGRLSGLLSVSAAGAIARADVDLRDLQLAGAPNGSVSMSGALHATIRAGFSLTFTSPFVKGVPDHDNLRLFPVTLTGQLTSNVALGPTRIRMADGRVSAEPVTVQIPITLTVPQGLGEHVDSDNPNSADGTHGPDEDQHRQELYTDTFNVLRVHIYLHAATYHFNAAVTLSASDNALDVDMTNLRLADGEHIRWHRDGGDLGIIGAIVGAIAGGLFFGPGGGLVGGIVGGIEGGNIDDAVNKAIAAKTAEKLVGLRYQWHVQH
jgi:hypothetical protein